MKARLLFLLALLAAFSSTARAGRIIDGVDAGDYQFGSMAIGQTRDLDYARAEGLGLVPALPFDEYLNRVLSNLLAQSPMRKVPARVYIRASGDWAAKTTADANIYVALGTLLRLDSEDELAALLAHEASHVLLGHADADIVTGLQERALQLSALAAEAQGFLRGEAVEEVEGKAADSAGVDEQSQALLLNSMIIVPAWTRRQERDADLLGIDLMVRAGYAPQAMVSLLRKQLQVEVERAKDRQASSLDEQLFGVDVHTEIREQTESAVRSIGIEDPGLGEFAGGTIGKVFEWGARKVDDVQRSHPRTEDRIAVAEEYIQSQYPSLAPKAPKIEAWEAAKEQDGTADVLDNYIAAIGARSSLADGDVSAARRLSKAGLAAPTQAHAYPNYVEAAVQLSQGSVALAQTAYETALAGPEPAGAIYTEATALYLRTGREERAGEVIESGYRRLEQPPSLTVPLIRTYRVLGRRVDAARIAADCARRWPKLEETCAEEARGRTAAAD